MSMKCPACGKNHWDRCTDKSVALWKRMIAGKYVDGDRYLSDGRKAVPAREFAREVNRLERRCSALTAENERLREALSAYPTADDPLATADLVKCATFTEESKQRRMIYVEKALFERLLKDKERLREALEQVTIGGNHLASSLIGWLGAGEDAFPKYTATYDEARSVIKDVAIYDAWVCWKTIMEARAALEAARGRQG